MKRILLAIIRLYQRYLSADTGIIGMYIWSEQICRFQPHCSEYTYQAINRYGILIGLWLGLKRIFRCHPWNLGGEDSVPTNL